MCYCVGEGGDVRGFVAEERVETKKGGKAGGKKERKTLPAVEAVG